MPTLILACLISAVLGESVALPDSHRAVLDCDPTHDRGGVRIIDADGAIRDSFSRPGYRPFVIRAGDIDGDGAPEIAVGLTDSAQFRPDRRMVKLHLFRLIDGRLVPFWFTERAYVDCAFLRGDDRDRLAVIERIAGNSWLRLYAWHGFGFWLDDEIELGRPHCRFTVSGEFLGIERADGKKVEFILEGDKLQTRTTSDRRVRP
jgi:hypothetical protein